MEDLVMKKLLAIILTLALALSFGATAFADGSPVKDVKTADLPAESEAVKGAVATGNAKIIPVENMTAEQKESMDKALAEAIEDGSLPVDGLAVESTEETTVTIALDANEVVYVVYPDGTVVKLLAKDLNKVVDGRYQISVDGSCSIVIAKAA